MSLRGGVQASFDGDVAAVSCAILPPWIGVCDYDYGSVASSFSYNFPSNFMVNGVRPNALPRFQWAPYGHQRMASATTGVQVHSESRMLNSEAAVLVRVTVGSLAAGTTATISAYLPLLLRDFSSSTWGWDAPGGDGNISHFSHSLMPGTDSVPVVLSTDTFSTAVAAASVWTDATSNNCSITLAPLGTGIAGFVSWSVVVNTNVPINFGFLFYVGRNASNVTASAAQLGGANFNNTWTRARNEADALWAAAFDSSSQNPFFSGSLPVVKPGGNVTNAMATVYYGSILSLLQNLKYPPVFADGTAPKNSTGQYSFPRWTVPSAAPLKAVSTIYLWDTAYASPILARLEPLAYGDILRGLLEAGVHQYYAMDTVSLSPVGTWYAFNDFAIHVMLTSFATYATADSDTFWTTTMSGMRAIDWLDLSATWWQRLPRVPSMNDTATVYLADYGLASNLLECVPTYLHAVPALNAANVWMMNTTAAVWTALGNTSRAAELQSMAESLLPLVVNQYTRDNTTGAGLGYFSCIYPDGSRVPVQHVIDFLTIADTIGPRLHQQMAAEMVSFMQNELLTATWMRALSLSDPAAPRSDRADHGPFGAYDSWPAKSIDGLLSMGYTAEAIAMFDRVAPVLREGPLGQSHRVYDNPLLPQLQTGKSAVDQQYAASNVASFAAVVLRIAGL